MPITSEPICPICHESLNDPIVQAPACVASCVTLWHESQVQLVAAGIIYAPRALTAPCHARRAEATQAVECAVMIQDQCQHWSALTVSTVIAWRMPGLVTAVDAAQSAAAQRSPLRWKSLL